MGKKDKDDDRKSEPSQRSPSSAAPGRSGSSSPSQPTRSAPVVREVENPNVLASYRDTNSWLHEGAPRSLGETTGGVSQPVNLAGSVKREPGTNPAVTPDTDKPVAPTPVAPTVIRKKSGSGLRLSPINPSARSSASRDARKGSPTKKVASATKTRGKKVVAAAKTKKPVARSSALGDAQQAKKGSAKIDAKPESRVCKARPTDTTPKRGGGGGKKRDFVPWCR